MFCRCKLTPLCGLPSKAFYLYLKSDLACPNFRTEIAVRDADTLTSLVHDANVPKVKLRVVRFFNQSDAEDLLISGGVGWHSSFSRNSFTAELLLPPVDANGLARRLAYVPDISQALAGKKMHHRWMERLGDGAGPGGVATTQRRPQSTSLNHFPTEALVAENVPSGADNQRPRGNTTDMVLNALQPVGFTLSLRFDE